LGRQGLHFSYFWHPFWEPFFIICLILFLNPQNQDFAIPYYTFEDFKHPKSSHFKTPLDHFFDPILEPPLEELFGQPWPPKVPTLPPHVDFIPFLVPPLDPKSALGAPRGGQKDQNVAGGRLTLGPLFDHFFDPILEPSLEEPFGQHWSPKVPTFPPHVDFWIPNRPLERPGAARKVKM
jgi:hypothetical protein